MMKCRARVEILVFLSVLLALPIFAQEQKPAGPSIAVRIEPSLGIPVLGDAPTFLSIGGGLKATGTLGIGGGSIPAYVALEASYDLQTVNLAGTLVHTVAAGPGIGISLPLAAMVSLTGIISGGYYATFLDQGGSMAVGGNPYASGMLGASLLLNPMVDIGLGLGYRQLFGLGGSFTVSLGTSIHLGDTSARSAQLKSGLPGRAQPLGPRKPDPGRGIRISRARVDSIFPVLRNFYDDHPIGGMELESQETGIITGITARLFIKGYMDSEKELDVPPRLEPGQTAVVDLYALLNKEVMAITESEKAPLAITLAYTVGTERFEDTSVRTVTIHGRNAMTWDDTRKAAAFVTRYDPTVQAIVRSLSSGMAGLRSQAVNRPLLTAMAVHNVTLLAGLQYRVDPTSSYATLSGQKSQIDTLNFPVQTLSQLGGDCDDLSILYCAVLEAMGVATAFVTVPGHIFVAFDLGTNPDAAARTFASADDLFPRGGHLWVPIEVTERARGFAEAWRIGAQGWKTSESGPGVGLYPLSDAFSLYSPVQAAETATALAVPDSAAVAAALKKDIALLRERELAPLLRKLAKQDPDRTDPAVQNRAAILQARFGDLDAAEATLRPFTQVPATAFVPALVNLGSVKMLRGRHEDALALYAAVVQRDPQNLTALAGMARAEYELGRIDEARAHYDLLRAESPALAAGIAYIGQEAGASSPRAAEAGDRGELAWAE